MTIQNDSGQILIETVLLIVVFLAAVTFIADSMRENEIIKTVVQGPWPRVDGMVQYGVWLPPEQALPFHPSFDGRQGSIDPEQVR